MNDALVCRPLNTLNRCVSFRNPMINSDKLSETVRNYLFSSTLLTLMM